MSAVKEKIAKLLALSSSPNNKEAQAALLKARELMAKHKLTMEECQADAQARTVQRTVGVEFTTMTDSWAVPLANTIGKRYCCAVFRRAAPRAKKAEIGFIGLEDDFDVCKRVYLYAYEYIKMRCNDIRCAQRHFSSAKAIRDMCNTFGWAFCHGLQSAFEEQEAQHQEWALAMVLPQPVQDIIAGLGGERTYSPPKGDSWRASYGRAGFAEGKQFDPTRHLESGGKAHKASA